MFKVKPILKSIMWIISILLFPITSGIIATIAEYDVIRTFVIQGCFVLASFIIPFIYVLVKKIRLEELGLCKLSNTTGKKVLYLIPVLVSEIPLLILGINLNNFEYVMSLILLTLAIGISEEVYFRGIILSVVNKLFIYLQSYDKIFSITSDSNT